MENKQTQNWFQRVNPFIAVIFIQCGYAGMDVLSKAALNKGMSNYVFTVYRHVVAFFVITPFALILDKKIRPKMTLSIFMKIVALGALEPVIDQNLYILGLKYTTPTFVAAMGNIIPAITFFLASILGLEKIKIKSIRTQAKVMGTLVTIFGAIIMTLVKGPMLGIFGSHGGNNHDQHNDGTNIQHPIKGAVLFTIGCISSSCFVILQTITLENYSADLSLTSWICLLGAVEGAVVGLIMERRNPSVWYLKWDVKLLATIYSENTADVVAIAAVICMQRLPNHNVATSIAGIVCSGLAYYLQGVVMKTRGPVFVTSFYPLSMVIVAFISSLFLAEQLYLGRVIGAIVIVLGLYLVVWGKSKDYHLPSPIFKEAMLSIEQISDKGNSEKQHSTHEVITVRNSGVGINVRNEQV